MREPCPLALSGLEPGDSCGACGRLAGEHRNHRSNRQAQPVAPDVAALLARIERLEAANRDLATANHLLDAHGAKLRAMLAVRDETIAGPRRLLTFERTRRRVVSLPSVLESALRRIDRRGMEVFGG